jgi:hypothetical protein
MFLKQLDQFMLQYHAFKVENIAKQQKCVTSRFSTRLRPVTSEVSYPVILQSMVSFYM